MALKVESREWYRMKLLRMLQKAAAEKSEIELIFSNRLYPREQKFIWILVEWAFMLGRIYQRLNDLKRDHLKLRDINGR